MALTDTQRARIAELRVKHGAGELWANADVLRNPCARRSADPVGSVTCGSCGGKVALKVFKCSEFGECTLGKRQPGLGCCEGCGRYKSPPPHPNVIAADAFRRALPPYPDGKYGGRGVVICGGGKYWASVYVTVRMLRHVGFGRPVQVWYLGAKERDDRYSALLAPFGVEVVDALAHPEAANTRGLTGFNGQAPFEVKSFAVLHSPFEEVLSIDADNYPCQDPTGLFDEPRYLATGGVYWPDLPGTEKWTRWDQWGVPKHGPEMGFEVGQYLISKRAAWGPLNLARWYDDHGDWCYGGASHHEHGDKNARVAWAAFKMSPAYFATRTTWKSFAFLQVGPDGVTPMWVHRCRSKMVLTPTSFVSTPQNGVNQRAGLPLEDQAFRFLNELSEVIR